MGYQLLAHKGVGRDSSQACTVPLYTPLEHCSLFRSAHRRCADEGLDYMPPNMWKSMENKSLLKLVLTSGILFLTGLSLFIVFARDQAQEFYGLTSTTVTGDANFLFYPLAIYLFLIFCSVMYFKTEALKYVEAVLFMCSAILIVRVFSLAMSGIELSDYTLIVVSAEILLCPIIGYLWYRENENSMA